jgi:Tol biopolymer transport system component
VRGGKAVAVLDVKGPGLATPEVRTDWSMWASYPDWRPNGDLIVFSTHDLASFGTSTEPANLYTIGPDGTGRTQITRYTDHDVRATQPTWTPDGTQIIFTYVRAASQSSVFGALGYRQVAFINPDGSGSRVLDGFSATHLGCVRRDSRGRSVVAVVSTRGDGTIEVPVAP